MIELPKSIAVFRLSALGDVLMFLPTVRALQRNFPQAKISWIISRPAYDLVKNINDIDFIVIDKPRSIKDYWQLKKRFQQYHFDILIAAQASFRAHTLYPLIRAKQKIGYDDIRGKEGHRFVVSHQIPFKKVHTLEGFMQFAEYIGAKELSVEWNLPLESQAKDWVEAKIKEWDLNESPLVVINPAASKSERSWHAQGYLEVISFLQSHYRANIVLCGGPSNHDKDLAEQIKRSAKVIDIVGQTKLPQLLALIAKADLVICPDTGPSHMAAAVNTPVIALHGVTKPEISGPYGQLHQVFNRYDEAKNLLMKTNLKEKPQDWFNKVHHPEVMNLIKAPEVCEHIKTYWPL
jgi:heptosyltransferase I